MGSINEYRERSRANKLRDKENKGTAKELFAIKATPFVAGSNPPTGANKSASTPNPTTSAPAFDGNKGLKAGELGSVTTASSSSGTDEQRESHLTAGAAAKAVLATVMLADGVPFKVPLFHPRTSFSHLLSYF